MRERKRDRKRDYKREREGRDIERREKLAGRQNRENSLETTWSHALWMETRTYW